MGNYLIVFVGAGLGGALRHGVNVAAMRLGWTAFPVATLFVNAAGCFVMGAMVEYLALRAQLPQAWRLFLTTGVLGGFTTFSAFALDTAVLAERGRASLAAAYVLATVLLSLGGLWAGLAAGRQLFRS